MDDGSDAYILFGDLQTRLTECNRGKY